MYATEMLHVETIRPDELPRCIDNDLERLGWIKLCRLDPLEKGEAKSLAGSIEKEYVSSALLGWITAQPGKGRNGFGCRNPFTR